MLRRDQLQRFRFVARVEGDYESVALGTTEAAALFGAKQVQKTGDPRPVEVRRMTDEHMATRRLQRMDIISHGDLEASSSLGETLIVRAHGGTTAKKVGRNAPCPCGSGQKCHGGPVECLVVILYAPIPTSLAVSFQSSPRRESARRAPMVRARSRR